MIFFQCTIAISLSNANSVAWEGYTIEWDAYLDDQSTSLIQTHYEHNDGYTRYLYAPTSSEVLGNGILKITTRVPGAFMNLAAGDGSPSSVGLGTFRYDDMPSDMSISFYQWHGPEGVLMIRPQLTQGNSITYLDPILYPASDTDFTFTGSYKTSESFLSLGNFSYGYNQGSTKYILSQAIVLDPASLSAVAAHPDQLGSEKDNPNTVFHAHNSPGTCSQRGQGLPLFSINTATRNLSIQDTIFRSEGLGPPLDLTMTYNADPTALSMLGRSWRLALDVQVEPLSGGAKLRRGSGQVLVFSNPSVGVPFYPMVLVAPVGVFDTMTAYSDRYELLDKETRQTWVFNQAVGNVLKLGFIRDQNGNTLAITRNPNGTIGKITDAAGRQANFSYDSSQHCTNIQTPDGGHITIAYDAQGNLTQVTDLAGVTTTYTYNGGNLLSSMTAAGKTTSFTFDSTRPGSVARVTDPLGQYTDYSYNTTTRTVTRTDPDGGTSIYGNTNGLTSTQVDRLGKTTSTAYNTANLPTSVTDARGKTTFFDYDSKGNCSKVTDPKGNITSYSYDVNSNLLSKTDPLGNIWTYLYDSNNNLVRVTTPLNRFTTYAYDAKGQLTSYTLPGGGVHSFSHDAYGQLTGMTDPVGNQTTLTYDFAHLNLASMTDPRGKTTTYQYDANRRLTRKTLADASSFRYEYDCCALSTITDPNNHVTAFNRDALLRISAKTDPMGKLTSYTYNSLDSLTSMTNALGQATSFGYDTDQRLTSLVNPLGKSVTLGLDPAGNTTSVTTERGKTSLLTYDAVDLQTTFQDPLGRTVSTITRDGNNSISTITNARGTTISLVRDAEGRITSKRYGATTVAAYFFDAAGNLYSVTDSIGTRTMNHDAAGRATSIGYPDGTSLSIAYDQADNIDSMMYPANLEVTYTYDARNRITGVAFAGYALSLGYDAGGNLTSETRSNGQQSAYTYDAADRLTGVSHHNGSSVLANLAYPRDSIGQIVSESGTYPLTLRLGSRNATSVFNDADGLVTSGGDAYTYDLDGNLTGISGSRSMVASYDAENRPTLITRGGTTRTYVYDGLGNRVRIQSGSTARNLHHDHMGRVVFETNASGQVTVEYIYAGNRLVASGTPSDGFLFYHYGKAGNTLALTNASGTVATTYAYSPFGDVINRSGPSATSFTYVGAYGVMDEGSGLFFMRNRYYDAMTGRFLQRDPISFAGGYNLYRYVGDNPVSRTDPLGLMGDDVGGGFERWNQAVHSMSPQERQEMLVFGVGTSLAGMTFLAMADSFATGIAVAGSEGVETCGPAGKAAYSNAAKKLISKEKWDYVKKLYDTYNGRIPGLDPKSSAGFDWLMNAPMPAGDKVRVFTGMLKYLSRR